MGIPFFQSVLCVKRWGIVLVLGKTNFGYQNLPFNGFQLCNFCCILKVLEVVTNEVLFLGRVVWSETNFYWAWEILFPLFVHQG